MKSSRDERVLAVNAVVLLKHMASQLKFMFYLSCALALTGCATSAKSPSANSSDLTAPVTRAEAKSEACPAALLEAGASAKDCRCIENRLFEIGQTPGVLNSDKKPQALFGGDEGRRKIAIGLLRHDAIEQCGLFDPDHIVAKNL